MTASQPSDSNGDHFYSRVFAIIVTAILAAALYRIVMPFLGPLLWACFIAFLLYPVHSRLTKRLSGRVTLSAGLLTGATCIMLIGPLAGLSAAFASQAGDVIQWAQDTLAHQARGEYRHFADIPLIGPAFNWLAETFGIQTGQIQEWIAKGMKQLPQLLTSLGGHLFLGAVNTVLGFVLMLFMLFFFVRDGVEIVEMARDLIPVAASQRQRLFDYLASVTRAVVFGTGMTALIQGTLVGIAFLITGLNAPLVFGVVAALFALLPIGGTAFVWVPAVLVLIGQDRWGMAIVMLAFGLISSSIDNVIRPLLISGRAQVGTLTVFLGVLGGTAAFGPIGLFLGPVVLALIIALLRFVASLRRDETLAGAASGDNATPPPAA